MRNLAYKRTTFAPPWKSRVAPAGLAPSFLGAAAAAALPKLRDEHHGWRMSYKGSARALLRKRIGLAY